MKLKELLGIKKVTSSEKIKRYVFGIPVFKKTTKFNKIKSYFCGIPFWKVKFDGNKVKIYFLGIKVLSFVREGVCIESLDKELQTLKAFEVINSRIDCSYEEEL